MLIFPARVSIELANWIRIVINTCDTSAMVESLLPIPKASAEQAMPAV